MRLAHALGRRPEIVVGGHRFLDEVQQRRLAEAFEPGVVNCVRELCRGPGGGQLEAGVGEVGRHRLGNFAACHQHAGEQSASDPGRNKVDR